MNLLDNFINAFQVIFLNKLRSGLSMLGIIIGVSSVIVLVAVGEGAQQSIVSKVQSLWTNLITITPGVQKNSNVRVEAMGGNNSTKVLTDEHTEAIKTQITGLNGVAPELSARKQVIAGSNNTNTKIDWVTPDYEVVKNFKVTYGQFITQDDIDATRKIAVLGSTTATNLFGTEDPIGKDIIIASRIFQVVGVMETKGSSGMSNSDDVIFIPLSTAEKITLGTTYLSSISVSVTDSEQMTTKMEEIKVLLMRMLGIANEDDINFTIQNQADALETVSSITDTLKIFLGGISAISLVVWGIGVMNIMLVSVTERTREIGIRKALGARRKDILLQFLTESVVMSILGGLLGIAISYALTAIITATGLLTAVITTSSIAMAFGFSAFIGIFFGLLPAYKAAKLKPIDALRFE